MVLRKAYGGAYIVMDSRSIGADLALAWPTNEIAVMGAEGAANVVFRREIAARGRPGGHAAPRRSSEYRDGARCIRTTRPSAAWSTTSSTPARPARCWHRALSMLRAKHADLPRRKHGNPPQ